MLWLRKHYNICYQNQRLRSRIIYKIISFKAYIKSIYFANIVLLSFDKHINIFCYGTFVWRYRPSFTKTLQLMYWFSWLMNSYASSKDGTYVTFYSCNKLNHSLTILAKHGKFFRQRLLFWLKYQNTFSVVFNRKKA